MSNFSSIKPLSELTDISTLTEMLAFRAQHTPDQDACTFEGGCLTFRQLWDSVNRVAGFLMQEGVDALDRVVVIMPNSLEFFPAFYGIQRAGGVAVPLFPGSGPQRILKIIMLSNARAVIVPDDTPDMDLAAYRAATRQHDCKVFRFGECDSYQLAETRTFPAVFPEDLAFFQYTSGSTGESKGVQLSHRNLIANLRQMIAASQMTSDDNLVSWLPVYHDLGLILMTMAPFYVGASVILLPTTLTNMNHWLNAITEYRGTYTAAPDIGYRMALKQVKDPSQYDLSSLRIAINAAEPVRASTIEAFESTFNIPNVMKPAYGLAEASVGVTFWGYKPRPVKVDERGFVAVGKAIPDLELKIVRDEEEMPPGEIGEIVFKSPSATRGYFKNPEATEKLFWREDYLYTGDMGYFDDEGDLFIAARKKNMIKQGGRSLAPREIEEIVDSIPRIRYSAAVGIDRGRQEGEQAYVFAETRLLKDTIDQEAPLLVQEIVRRIYENLGFRPGRVYLVRPHTIPFTYNGKIQHAQLKEAYLNGALKEQLIYPTY